MITIKYWMHTWQVVLEAHAPQAIDQVNLCRLWSPPKLLLVLLQEKTSLTVVEIVTLDIG
jgi:hypothetical protein